MTSEITHKRREREVCHDHDYTLDTDDCIVHQPVRAGHGGVRVVDGTREDSVISESVSAINNNNNKVTSHAGEWPLIKRAKTDHRIVSQSRMPSLCPDVFEGEIIVVAQEVEMEDETLTTAGGLQSLPGSSKPDAATPAHTPPPGMTTGSASMSTTTGTTAGTHTPSTDLAATSGHSNVSDRRRLNFPVGLEYSTAQQYEWYMALLKQHPAAEPLFKEGRRRPYITVKSGAVYTKLTTNGFNNIIMEPAEDRHNTVVIHDVPLYVNTNLLDTPENFLWIKRRTMGNRPRPQLIGVVEGNVPVQVHILGVGRKPVELYTPEPDLCKHCNRWGHQEWRCRSAPRCRYCAARHKSSVCLKKIQEGIKIVPRCCNCGGEHNAHSNLCPMKPRPTRGQDFANPQQERPKLVFRPAPPPTTSAWITKPSVTPPIGAESPTALPQAPTQGNLQPAVQTNQASSSSGITTTQQTELQQLITMVAELQQVTNRLEEKMDNTIRRVNVIEKQLVPPRPMASASPRQVEEAIRENSSGCEGMDEEVQHEVVEAQEPKMEAPLQSEVIVSKKPRTLKRTHRPDASLPSTQPGRVRSPLTAAQVEEEQSTGAVTKVGGMESSLPSTQAEWDSTLAMVMAAIGDLTKKVVSLQQQVPCIEDTSQL